MNLNEWCRNTEEIKKIHDTASNDLRTLSHQMEVYLKGFLDYDSAEWSHDLKKVTLKWGYQGDPIISPSIFNEIGIPFKISWGPDDKLGTGVWIIFYPFGLPDEVD